MRVLSRRLPIYLLLDVSGSMCGAPIEAVNNGLKDLEAALKSDPHALESAYVSIIAFESDARQIMPLTEAGQFRAPILDASGGTSLGKALSYLGQCLDREVHPKSATHPGDWKPLIFLMTDGEPTDDWQGPSLDFKRRKAYRPANLIAIGCGPHVNTSTLRQLTETGTHDAGHEPREDQVAISMDKSVCQGGESVCEPASYCWCGRWWRQFATASFWNSNRPIIQVGGAGVETDRKPSQAQKNDDDNLDWAASSAEAAWKNVPPEETSDPVDDTKQFAEQVGHWKLFGASRRGKSHAHSGTYREDDFEMGGIATKNSECWAIAVSDGAGSCRLSRVGAHLCVRAVIGLLRQDDNALSDPKNALKKAVRGALTTLEEEAAKRQCDTSELSCTLLVLLWKQDSEEAGGTALSFQAGDGLIASFDENSQLNPMATQDAEAFAGETHFLTSKIVRSTWDDRFKSLRFETPPDGFLVMSDGVADDLIPYEKNGPILVRELHGILCQENSGEAMVELLGYEKRGSFDDRTLVCAFLPKI